MLEIKNIMTTDVITVTKQTLIQGAIEILVRNNITGFPVVNDDMTLAGIISEKDIMKLLCKVGNRPGRVEEFMTTNVISFDLDDSIVNVCDCLLKNHFRRVPIVTGPKQKLVGIITRKDIIKKIFHCQSFFRDTPYVESQLSDARMLIEQSAY